MAKKPIINFTLQGKPVSATTLKVELIESYQDEMYQTAGAIIQDLDELVERLSARTTNRGVGKHADEYNDPLKGLFAESEISRSGKTIRIFVPVGDKGSPGYKFNLLDQGRPPLTTAKLMKFVSYAGTKTKVGDKSNTVNRKSVISPSKTDTHGDWVSTHHVDGVEPRKFFESIVKNRKFTNPKVNNKFNAKINRKPPKFKWSPGTVDIKVKRD